MRKNRLHLTEAEWRHIIYALNELRTSLIREGKHTDIVDETLLKVLTAPVKK